MSATNKDLIPAALQRDIDWSHEKSTEAVEKLCEYADAECSKAIGWYFSRKQSKQMLGMVFRVLAIIAVAAAGVIPILGEIFETNNGTPGINPAWATIALALAALFIALDRFGGHTNGWIRYVRTGMALCHLQTAFRTDWSEQQLTLPPASDSPDAPVKLRIKLCRDFLAKVNELVANETTEWAREFQTALVEIERGASNKQ